MCLPCWAGEYIDRQLIKSHFTIITVTVGVKPVKFECSVKTKSTNQSAVCGFWDAARLDFDLIFKNKLVFSLRVLPQFWVTFIMLPTFSFCTLIDHLGRRLTLSQVLWFHSNSRDGGWWFYSGGSDCGFLGARLWMLVINRCHFVIVWMIMEVFSACLVITLPALFSVLNMTQLWVCWVHVSAKKATDGFRLLNAKLMDGRTSCINYAVGMKIASCLFWIMLLYSIYLVVVFFCFLFFIYLNFEWCGGQKSPRPFMRTISKLKCFAPPQ